jgi:hypothetical protein
VVVGTAAAAETAGIPAAAATFGAET